MPQDTQVMLIGIIGLIAVAACWAFAVVLYRVSTVDSVARKLALLLVLEGFVLISAEFPEMAFNIPLSIYDSYPTLYFALDLVHSMGDAAMIALYPPFLALALNTSITRQFAGKRTRMVLAIGAAILGLFVVCVPSRMAYTVLYLVVTLVFIYALVASIHAWRTAKSGMVRQRAGLFALAFGLRDFGWSISYAISAWFMWTNTDYGAAQGLAMLMKFVYAMGTLLAVPLIAYGILRAHLFDIDLRIRWTIKQSTVGIAIFVIIFLVSEGAESLLSEQLGNYWGLLAAAVIAIALRPVQRFAERVSTAAMPNTQDTPEYKTNRKRQVYESAIEEALMDDGGISDRERSLLNRLRDSLDISQADAEALENELQLANQAGQ